MQSHTATIIPPGQGKTFSFFGNTVTYKHSGAGQNNRIYELVGTSQSHMPPLHAHPWDEWFYFLEGEIEFQAGNRLVLATPGYVVTLPAGVPHTFAIKSPHAKFLVWVSNAAAERYIEALIEAGRDHELSPQEVQAIGQIHHIKLVEQHHSSQLLL
jgi:quercetin dioxygenase-like cupin family protein